MTFRMNISDNSYSDSYKDWKYLNAACQVDNFVWNGICNLKKCCLICLYNWEKVIFMRYHHLINLPSNS